MSIRHLLSIALMGILPALPAAAGGQFHVHQPTLNAVKVVALLPMRPEPALLDTLQDSEQLIGRIEAGVAQRLRDAGYTVVEPAHFNDFWAIEQPKVGALYHPFTGDRIEEAHKKVQANTMRRLRETYPHDATLDLSLYGTFAPVKAGSIEWDDVRESAAGQSAFADYLLNLDKNNEMLRVLSLHAVLRDRNGEAMFTGKGGLQPMQISPMGFFAANKPMPLLNDPKREARAMDIALGAWLMKPAAYKEARERAQSKLFMPPTRKPSAKPKPFDLKGFAATKPTLAIAPLNVPDYEGNVAMVRARIDPLIADWLRTMGYRVVPASGFVTAWNNAITNSFGIYDETTGRAIRAARAELVKQVMNELHEKHGVNALVVSGIARRMVDFSNGYARWDGQSELIPGAALNNTNRLHNYFGVVPAISLNISLLDAEGDRIVDGAGGIQVIQRYTQGQFVAIEQKDWFRDRNANSQAVWQALRPVDATEKERKKAAKAEEKAREAEEKAGET